MANKRITVFSNDPETPKLFLTLKGEVVREVVATPSSVSFGTLTKKEAAEKELTLTVSEPEKVKMTSVEIADDRFEAVLKEGDSSTKATYTIKYKGSDTIERVATQLKVNLEGADISTVDVPIRAHVVGDLKYTSILYFSKRGEAFKSRDIKIESRSGTPFKVLKAEDPDKNVKLEMDKKQGTEVVIKASVADPKKAYSPSVRGALVIKTNDKDEPELSLRYTISEGMRRGPRAARKPLADPASLKRKREALGKRPLIKPSKDSKKEP
jgi:hypothetical protein